MEITESGESYDRRAAALATASGFLRSPARVSFGARFAF